MKILFKLRIAALIALSASMLVLWQNCGKIHVKGMQSNNTETVCTDCENPPPPPPPSPRDPACEGTIPQTLTASIFYPRYGSPGNGYRAPDPVSAKFQNTFGRTPPPYKGNNQYDLTQQTFTAFPGPYTTGGFFPVFFQGNLKTTQSIEFKTSDTETRNIQYQWYASESRSNTAFRVWISNCPNAAPVTADLCETIGTPNLGNSLIATVSTDPLSGQCHLLRGKTYYFNIQAVADADHPDAAVCESTCGAQVESHVLYY